MSCPSTYGSKMILDRPNNFDQVPTVLRVSNLFCRVQIILDRSKLWKLFQKSLI
jgi:hypothetical protein